MDYEPPAFLLTRGIAMDFSFDIQTLYLAETGDSILDRFCGGMLHCTPDPTGPLYPHPGPLVGHSMLSW